MLRVVRPEAGEERISVLRLVEGHQKVEGQLSLPFSSSGLFKPFRSRNRRRTRKRSSTAESEWFIRTVRRRRIRKDSSKSEGYYFLPDVFRSAMPMPENSTAATGQTTT
jgi:hypothetical protein